MPNLNSDQLFQLIKSLSKAEKRYFKIYVLRLKTGKDAKYLKLFDLIDKQKEFDEKLILAKEKKIKPSQLSNLKANLYKQILKSLRNNIASEDLNMSIREQLDYSKILYNKCLYDQCFKMIEKTRSMAEKYERPAVLFDIIEFEKNLVGNFIKVNIQEKVTELTVEGEQTLNKLKNINTFTNLSLNLYAFYSKIGYIRDQKDFGIANSFLYSSLPIFKEDALSFEEKIHLYHSLTSYHFFIQDFNRALEYSEKWIELFDNKHESIVSRTEMYLKAVNSLLKAQNKLYKYNEFVETLKRFDDFKKLKNVYVSYNIKLVLFKYYSFNKINQYFMLGDFDEGVKIIPPMAKELEKFAHKMDFHSILIFYYKFACLYFGCDEYQKASYWLNKIINAKDIDLRADIISFARILNLICHYELENMDLVDYYIKSTFRFLMKKQDFHLFQKYIIKFLRRLGYISRTELPGAFKELYDQLLPLTNDPYEKRAFIYFDIISWLESKIQKRPVKVIMQEKAQKYVLLKNKINKNDSN